MEYPWGSAVEGSDEFLSYYVKQQLFDRKNLSSEEELQQQALVIYKAFVVADNGDGELNFKELKRMCEDLGLPIEDSEEEDLGKKDKDGTGTLDLDEVMCWWLQRVGCLPNPAKQQEALARNTFKKFDNDGSGSLDVVEMKKLFIALGAKFSDKEMEEVMQQLDSSGDGMIDEEEFIEWWTNRALNNRRGGGLLALKLRKLASKAQQLFSTDIFTAAWQGDLELVKLFISTEPRNALSQDPTEFGDGWTPLHYACYRGHVDLVKVLIDSTDNKQSLVNRTNDKGFTALFYAAQMSQPEICRLLLDAGADPTISGSSDEFGESIVSFCPADLSKDFPELDEMLRAHNKCTPPEALPSERVEASLNRTSGVLTLDFVLKNTSPASFLRGICSLPVRKWKVELDCSSDVLRPLIFNITPSPQPEKQDNLSVSCSVDRKWLRAVLAEKGADASLTIQVCAINALRDEGPMTDALPVVLIGAMPPLSKAPSVASEGSRAEKTVEETN